MNCFVMKKSWCHVVSVEPVSLLSGWGNQVDRQHLQRKSTWTLATWIVRESLRESTLGLASKFHPWVVWVKWSTETSQLAFFLHASIRAYTNSYMHPNHRIRQGEPILPIILPRIMAASPMEQNLGVFGSLLNSKRKLTHLHFIPQCSKRVYHEASKLNCVILAFNAAHMLLNLFQATPEYPKFSPHGWSHMAESLVSLSNSADQNPTNHMWPALAKRNKSPATSNWSQIQCTPTV